MFIAYCTTEQHLRKETKVKFYLGIIVAVELGAVYGSCPSVVVDGRDSPGEVFKVVEVSSTRGITVNV